MAPVDTSVTYQCNYCEYESDSRRAMKIHISNAGQEDEDDPHNGKRGDTPGAYTDMTDTTEIEENNERVTHEGGNATYTGPAEGLDMTMQHISERKVTELEPQEKILIGLDMEQIAEIVSAEISDETRRDILQQLVGM